jgi:hypothetical protein
LGARDHVSAHDGGETALPLNKTLGYLGVAKDPLATVVILVSEVSATVARSERARGREGERASEVA